MQTNYFEELKETEILRERLTTLRDVEDHIGKYYSRKWVITNVLQMTEEEYKEIQLEIEEEKESGEIVIAGDQEQQMPDQDMSSDVDYEEDENT